MGFNVNFNKNKPVIKESQAAHDGGAGNLGYFEQGENKKHKNKDEDLSVFLDENEQEDSFIKTDSENDLGEPFSISRLIAQIILACKDFFKVLFKK